MRKILYSIKYIDNDLFIFIIQTKDFYNDIKKDIVNLCGISKKSTLMIMIMNRNK
jgi:hypothetical protein